MPHGPDAVGDHQTIVRPKPFETAADRETDKS
jgi:hypothetical protein